MTKGKVSNDEGKLLECRESLIQEEATVERSHNTLGQRFEKSSEDLRDKGNLSECRGSLLQEKEKVEHAKPSHGLKGSKNEDCIASTHDIFCDDALDFTGRREERWGREQQMQHGTKTDVWTN